MDIADTSHAVQDDYSGGPANAQVAPKEVKRQVDQWVREARASARVAVLLEEGDAYTESSIDTIIDHVQVNRRSFGFPRSSVRDGGWWARKLVWALVNLATAMGLSPTTLRELAPILKGGADGRHSMWPGLKNG